jgi:hypothetical protein
LQEFHGVALSFQCKKFCILKTSKGESSMKRLTLALTLACLLSVPALAGQIPWDYTPPPPPDPPPGMVADAPGDISSVPGQIPCDLMQQAESAAYAGLVAVVGWLV